MRSGFGRARVELVFAIAQIDMGSETRLNSARFFRGLVVRSLGYKGTRVCVLYVDRGSIPGCAIAHNESCDIAGDL